MTAGAMLRVAQAAAEKSEADIEIIDLLTLWPWDRADGRAIGCARPARLVTLEEAPAGTRLGRRCRRDDRRRVLRAI